MSDPDVGRHGFWSSLPGFLTALGTLIGAVAAAWVAFQSYPGPPHVRDSVVTAASQTTGPSQPHESLTNIGSLTFAGEMGPLEPGISYNQGDIYDQPAESAERCSRICYDDNRCLAATFVISQKRCWVKNTLKDIGRSPDMVSARRLVVK
jgi:hypothetical protein